MKFSDYLKKQNHEKQNDKDIKLITKDGTWVIHGSRLQTKRILAGLFRRYGDLISKVA